MFTLLFGLNAFEVLEQKMIHIIEQSLWFNYTRRKQTNMINDVFFKLQLQIVWRTDSKMSYQEKKWMITHIRENIKTLFDTCQQYLL